MSPDMEFLEQIVSGPVASILLAKHIQDRNTDQACNGCAAPHKEHLLRPLSGDPIVHEKC